MKFIKYMFTPQLYKEYGYGSYKDLYKPPSLEKWSDTFVSTIVFVWRIGYYTSPIIAACILRGNLVVESLTNLMKLTTGLSALVLFSLCLRSCGRSQSQTYVKFIDVLDKYKVMPNTINRKLLANFDFDFRQWPVDFDCASALLRNEKRDRISQTSSPYAVVAYLVAKTLGIRLMFPGCLKILQKMIEPALLQGRSKLIELERGSRYKVKTIDSNEIDLMFVDNRENSSNGKILVICSEGNAGFYEIGIMSTPLSLKYSVLGWNHPGFAGSTGLPFPKQDENAINSVVNFAVNYLKFPHKSIVLFGWSIGGYATLWAGIQFSEIKGIILDATFDDILHLAHSKFPNVFSNLVKVVIRNYLNLSNLENACHYNGPILLIRRTNDEIICTEENNMRSNRGNFLLVSILKNRFPNVFKPAQVQFALELLAQSIENRDESNVLLESIVQEYVSDFGVSYPLLIGKDWNDEQLNRLVDFLVINYNFYANYFCKMENDFYIHIFQ